jgi:hypothetical protein
MDVLLALKPTTQISDQTILVFDVHFRCLAAQTDSTFLDQARDIAS